jgi:hypothetical protein
MPKPIQIIFKNSYYTAKETQLFSFRKSKGLMLSMEIDYVHSEKHMKQISIKERVTAVKASGTYSTY